MKESITHILRALRLICSASLVLSVVDAVLIIVRGMMPLLLLLCIKIIIDSTVEQISSGTFSWSNSVTGLVLIVVFFVLNPLTASIYTIVREKHSYALNRKISDLIHAKTTTIGYGFFEDPTAQNNFFQTIHHARTRPQAVFFNMMSIFQNGLTLLVICVVMFSIHWIVPVIILALALPTFWLRVRLSRKLFELEKSQTNEQRQALYYDRVLTGKEYAKEVRIFHLGNYFRKKYIATNERLHLTREKILKEHAVNEIVTQALMSVACVVLFASTIYMASIGQITIGALAMYFMAMYRCYRTAQNMLLSVANLYEANLFLKNFFAFLDFTPENKSVTEKFPNLQRSIKVENLSYVYPNGKVALSNVSFEIKAGETVAIVGKNGAGKTTLIKLLCGLLEPNSGRILIDDVDLRNISKEAIAGNITAIFQDFMLYNATARDNIRLGEVSTDDEKNIRLSAENAGIGEVFDNLKNGYDTYLGTLFEGSEMLSRGQWQRTALARAFYSNAQIIFLDEPTAALDAETIKDLQANFRKIVSSRTAIIVSHRQETIEIADRVIEI